jgi:LysM repeat protein
MYAMVTFLVMTILFCGCERVVVPYSDEQADTVAIISEPNTAEDSSDEICSSTDEDVTEKVTDVWVTTESETAERQTTVAIQTTVAVTTVAQTTTIRTIASTQKTTATTENKVTTTTQKVIEVTEAEEVLDNPPMPTDMNSSYIEYYVSPGDCLSVIASEWGISTNYLAEYNGIGVNDSISPGQVLRIPDEYASNGTTHQQPQMVAELDDSVPVLSAASDGLVCYGAETKKSTSASANSFTNMEIASGVLTNEVAYIPPGGDFSWLRDVGPCTGPPYIESTGYNGGKSVQVYGGGICMTASALKVAAMRAGCIITETHIHFLPVPYNSRDYDGWQDYESTIDASGLDLKFRNPSYTTGLTIRVYTDKNNKTCTAELIPDFLD